MENNSKVERNMDIRAPMISGTDNLSDDAVQRPNETEAITNLQRYLRQLSYTDSDIPPVPVDGIFGEATSDALTAFQRKNGLSPSGRANRATWDMLFAEYLRSVDENTQPLLLPLFPRVPDSYSVRPGSESFLVRTIQYILGELLITYGIMNGSVPPEQTGIYDTATENLVKNFQLQNGIDATGNTDKTTWDRLVTLFDNMVSEYDQ